MFWFGIVVTALWLVGIGVGVIYLGKDISAMDLNEIGDALAGAFAPIAFLWLFIATWMQRIELGLQRQELADTRAVMDEQRQELERAAKESNHQTIIMQETLATSQAREIYDEFSLMLYFSAKRIASEAKKITIHLQVTQSYSDSRKFIKLPDDFEVSSLDPSSVDAVFDGARLSMNDLNTALGFRASHRSGRDVTADDFYALITSIHAISLSVIGNPSNGGNRLIKARCQGLFMDDLVLESEKLLQRLQRY